MVSLSNACVYRDYDLSDQTVHSDARWVRDNFELGRANNFRIPLTARIIVARPSLPTELRSRFAQLGVDIQRLQLAALREKFPYVIPSHKASSVDTVLREAATLGQDFLVYPSAVRWHETQLATPHSCVVTKKENRKSNKNESGSSDQVDEKVNCEWDIAMPFDKAVLTVFVYEVATKSLLDTFTVRAKSGFFTFFGDTPLGLLPRPLSELAAELADQ